MYLRHFCNQVCVLDPVWMSSDIFLTVDRFLHNLVLVYDPLVFFYILLQLEVCSMLQHSLQCMQCVQRDFTKQMLSPANYFIAFCKNMGYYMYASSQQHSGLHIFPREKFVWPFRPEDVFIFYLLLHCNFLMCTDKIIFCLTFKRNPQQPQFPG